MANNEKIVSSPDANTAIVRSWLYALLSELELNKVLSAEKTQNANILTIEIMLKY